MKTEIKDEYLGGERKDTVSRDAVAMQIAQICSKESKDPSTQVGACIVSSDGRIISTGFNHNPEKWEVNRFPWGNDVRNNGEGNTKYPYIIHAELDAICKCTNLQSLNGAAIYVTLFPCEQCAKIITAFGIKKVVYFERRNTQSEEYSERTFDECGIECTSYQELTNSKTKRVKIRLRKEGEN